MRNSREPLRTTHVYSACFSCSRPHWPRPWPKPRKCSTTGRSRWSSAEISSPWRRHPVVLDLFSRQDLDAQVLWVSAASGWKDLQYHFVAAMPQRKCGPVSLGNALRSRACSRIPVCPFESICELMGRNFSRTPLLRNDNGGAVRIPDARVTLPAATLQRLGGPETLATYEQKEQGTSESKDTTIRIRGVIALRRRDGIVIGADRVKVKVHDDEGPYKERSGQGYPTPPAPSTSASPGTTV